MKKMKRNGRFQKSIAFVLVLILFTSVFQVILLNLIADLMKNTSSVSSIDTDKTGTIQSLDVTETKQWITNPTFDIIHCNDHGIGLGWEIFRMLKQIRV